ncbi:hypothetical protein EXIGLDRAFT_834892 [Exidia glandulosa HHB12029]|uniref:Uncharacterized protein n=1 Tax=Exidia glandulosa HHB12029 TaxID=1314781 RepID=A0A165JAI3_EXIGL|nr:hypothetical protein EXIGLDRAFT_834892 [Exidia glandulosa HHB12029]
MCLLLSLDYWFSSEFYNGLQAPRVRTTWPLYASRSRLLGPRDPRLETLYWAPRSRSPLYRCYKNLYSDPEPPKTPLPPPAASTAMLNTPSPLQIIVTYPRWVVDISNDVLYNIVEQLLLTVEWTIDTEKIMRSIISPPPPPQGSILSLTYRYSRTRDATTIFYYRKAELTRTMLYERYQKLRTARLMETRTATLLWDMATSSWSGSKEICHSPDSYTTKAENQISRILDAWRRITDAITQGRYYTSEQLANPRACDGFCTNVLDVVLLAELDALLHLETRYTYGSHLRQESCDTFLLPLVSESDPQPCKRRRDSAPCTGWNGVRPQVAQAFKSAVMQHHSGIDRRLFAQAFHDLGVTQPWPPRVQRSSKTVIYSLLNRGRSMVPKRVL